MSKEKILVVDDVEPICGLFERVLGKKDYEVDRASSGTQAYEMAKLKQYDLIFMDLVMPGMDGVQTCRAIKQVSPGSTLVFMTGEFGVDPLHKEIEFVAAGGKTYYLYKPFTEKEILETTTKALKERSK